MSDNAVSFEQEARRLVLEFLPILTATDDKDVVNLAVLSWTETFRMAWPIPEGADEGELKAQFGLFLRSLIPVTNVGNVKVRSSIKRTYGKVDVGFEIEDYAPRTRAGIEAGFLRCQQAVMREHERYVLEFLPKEQQSNGADDKNTNPSKDIEEMPCDRLSVRSEGDKIQVRAHGGRFSKFGVPVYDEVLQVSGIDPEEIPVRGQDTKDATMTVQMIGGKPRKVIKLQVP